MFMRLCVQCHLHRDICHAGLTELCGHVSTESFSAFDDIPTNGLVADPGLKTDGRT